jgi:SAM-dependent methyltransferase
MSALPDGIAPRAAAPVSPYDAIAGQYQKSKQSPLRRYVEGWSFFSILGEVRGFEVLDLACGDGFYTRQLRQRGAARVVGIDVSTAMIRLACEQSVDGVEYHVRDVQDLPPLGPFDVVCAAYLLHYARDVAELERMCRSVARQLPVGGRFVAINENPDQPEERYRGYLRYGFSKTVVSPRREGSPITYAMVSGRELFRFEAYHYERETYERALAAAGFTDIRWHALSLDPAGVAALGEAWFAEYLGNPPIVGLSCTRGR